MIESRDYKYNIAMMNKFCECIGSNVYMADNFSDLSAYVESLNSKVLWVFDNNTSRMVRPIPAPNIILECGEDSKSLKSVERILQKAFESDFDKDSIIIAMGGGVVLDTAAFAASIYKRGCKLVFIPTTLLAMCDACIGGKTAVDFNNTKNIIGTYFPATDVILCTDCLQSLTEASFQNGLGEVIKTAFLSKDDELLKELVLNKKDILKREDSALKRIVGLSVKIKSDYVNRDPKEQNGIRYALNLGHTFGHALESLRRMNVNHGQAVAWGVCRSAVVSKELNLCSDYFATSIIRLYEEYGFDTNYKINYGEWNEYHKYLMKDKKIRDNKLKFILLTEQGSFTFRELDERIIKHAVIEGPETKDVLL